MIRIKIIGMTFILGLICCFSLFGCGTPRSRTEKFCGYELTDNQVIEIKKKGSNAYDYSDNDLDILSDITTDVHGLFNDSLEIEVFLFLMDKDNIGLYFIGPDDQTIVEKIGCLLLSDRFGDKIPKNRYLLFYCNEHENLVAGIRNKN